MPRSYKEKIEELLKFSGSRKSPQGFVNYSITISIAIGFIAALFVREYALLMGVGVFIAFFGLFHGFLILAVDRRTKFIEKILPDALQLMAANIKSGFIPSRAMLLSARKEFGPLSDAIKRSGKEMMTGKPLQESLREIPKTIKSEILETTIGLIVRGIRSGGQLVSLFEETAIDMRRKESIRKEVKANILMYGIFIGFAGAVGAPVLYALSTFLVTTIGQIGAVTQVPEEFATGLPMVGFGGISISPDFLLMFSIAAILITTIFGGLIMGIIDSGKEKAGIKYIPILTVIALVVFFSARMLISGIFGTLIP
ncbi:MAG: type II secretion system F family protein [Candidatus Aenigmatarchaeota archaeon]|nr:MAG: type II secretion system F family protein [Candidatus Aenigmarchaeota archaeon]